MDKYILGTIFSTCIFIFFVLFASNKNLTERHLEFTSVFLIMALNFILRWLSIHIMKTEQVSDFAAVHNAVACFQSKGTVESEALLRYFGNYYAKFPAWFPYMRLVSSFYELFCHGEINTEAVKYANAFLNTLTCGGIYYLGKSFFSKRVAYIASLLYCCWPSLIIWTNITCPDHITMLLFVIQAALWYQIWKYKDNIKLCAFLICLHSIICALINWFKPLVILFLLVYAFYIIIIYDRQNKKNILIISTIYLVSFLICFKGGSKILEVWVENYIQQDVVDSTWYYLYVGNVMGSDGKMDTRKADENAKEINRSHNDLEEQMNAYKEMAIIEFQKNKSKYPILWLSKFNHAMNSEGNTFYWSNRNDDREYKHELDDVLGLEQYFISNQYYLLILICISLCAFSQIISTYQNKNIYYLFLTVSGYIAILVLGGVQSRYKLIITPYLALLSAYGVDFVFNTINKRLIPQNIAIKFDLFQ